MKEASFCQGKKVYLRSLVKEDIQGNWFKWFNDPDINKYMLNGTFPNNVKSFESFLDNQVCSSNNLILAVCDIETKEHIGNIGIHNIDWVNGLGEYGIVMGEKKYWGKGYSKEASSLLINHAFNRLNLRKIWLGVLSNHLTAIKLYEKLGFKKEAELENEIKRNNEYINIIRMRLFLNEWLNGGVEK
jgi:[ribosomal protein S5]-alanine N-acetyltransferase